RFAYGQEQMPPVDWAKQPKLETTSWPEERRLMTFRAYAVEYLRTMLPTLQELLRPDGAQAELGRVARLLGLQVHEETAPHMDLPPDVERGDEQSAQDFARWLGNVLRAQGEDVEITKTEVRMRGWRAVRDLKLVDPIRAFDAWNELWLGAAAAHDRFLKVQTTRSLRDRGLSIAWRIAPR